MVTTRELSREEIPGIWKIDRAEVIDNIYYLVDGALELRPEHYDMAGWPPGEPDKYTPLLLECFDHGGWFCAAPGGEAPGGEAPGHEGAGGKAAGNDTLAGVAVLENRRIGRAKDMLQLKLLHVSRGQRKQGLGRLLFEMAAAEAHRRGARRLYISATPSENTINFYMGLGCSLAQEVDPELFALEPEDIHLEFLL